MSVIHIATAGADMRAAQTRAAGLNNSPTHKIKASLAHPRTVQRRRVRQIVAPRQLGTVLAGNPTRSEPVHMQRARSRQRTCLAGGLTFTTVPVCGVNTTITQAG